MLHKHEPAALLLWHIVVRRLVVDDVLLVLRDDQPEPSIKSAGQINRAVPKREEAGEAGAISELASSAKRPSRRNLCARSTCATPSRFSGAK